MRGIKQEPETDMDRVRIGLVGDRSEGVVAHGAIERTLTLARREGTYPLDWSWMETAGLRDDDETEARLGELHGLWSVPATPYVNPEGALHAIRFARTRGLPFLGTCGGFQLALVEYARSVLGIRTADHAETNPGAEALVVTPLACALVETTGHVNLKEGSRIRAICGEPRLVEGYHCSFGVNEAYRPRFEAAGLRFGSEDDAGDVRSFELEGHPFFLGTLFQPERSALTGGVHPLCSAFLGAAADRRG